jgi:hypothetical protein
MRGPAIRFSDLKSWISENNLEIFIFLALGAWRIYQWYQDRSFFNLIALLAVLGAVFFGFTYQIRKMILRDARVLVCGLGANPALAEEAESHADIYRRHFPYVELLKTSKLADLLATLSSSDFRILHIVSEFAADGMLIETEETHADVASLFELCRSKRLMFVYFGGNIPGEKRAAVFERVRAARVRHDFPLVITTERGMAFASFLDRLLQEISNGKVFGKAWLTLRPQDAVSGAPQPLVDPGPKGLLLL